jgi:protein-L-isoaspartate(D-aspartate) O-methyltransferase
LLFRTHMTLDFAAARLNMLEGQVRTCDVTDHAIQEAIRTSPREALVPAGKRALAYAEIEIEYAPGRFLMKPRDVSKLLQAMRPRKGERALAICAPYAAQVMQAMGLSVDRLDDGDLGAPKGSDYAVIVCEQAVSQAPKAWLDVLGPGGRMALVERNGPVGKARLWLMTETGVASREVFDATPPMLPGFEKKPQFAF